MWQLGRESSRFLKPITSPQTPYIVKTNSRSTASSHPRALSPKPVPGVSANYLYRGGDVQKRICFASFPGVAYEFPPPSRVLEQPASGFPIWHNHPCVRCGYRMLPVYETGRRFSHTRPPNGLAALAWLRAFGRHPPACAAENLARTSTCGLGRLCSVRLASRHVI